MLIKRNSYRIGDKLFFKHGSGWTTRRPADFNETDHPRDANGRFIEKGGAVDTALGQEFKCVRGQDAVHKLLQERRGHVKNAFRRADIGGITLLWGDEKSGLQHIISRRTDQNINIDDFIKDLTEVIETGKFVRTNERGRYEILKNGKMAIISPQLRDGKVTYLFTAYKTREK